MADLSFTQEEASTVLSKSNDAAVDSETKMKEIIQKVSSYFGAGGSAMSGNLGNVMDSSFEGDIKPIFDDLNNELSSLINSVSTTNVAMQNLNDETTQLYQAK